MSWLPQHVQVAALPGLSLLFSSSPSPLTGWQQVQGWWLL